MAYRLMAPYMLVLLVTTAVVHSAPTGLSQSECSATVFDSNNQSLLVPLVLKSHHCYTSNRLLSLYQDNDYFESVRSDNEGRSLCIGLSALVSYGRSTNLIDDVCKKASFENEDYCKGYKYNSQTAKELHFYSNSLSLPREYSTALSVLADLQSANCVDVCGELKSEMCFTLLHLGQAFVYVKSQRSSGVNNKNTSVMLNNSSTNKERNENNETESKLSMSPDKLVSFNKSYNAWKNLHPEQQTISNKSRQNARPRQQQFNGKPWQNAQPGQQQFNGKPWQNAQPGQQQFNGKPWQNAQPGQQQFNGKPWQNAQSGQQQFNGKSWQNAQPGQQQFNGKPWQNAQSGQQQFNSKSWQNRQPGQQQFNSKSWQNAQPGQQQFNGKPWQNAQPGQQQFNGKPWQNAQPGQQQFNGKPWQNAQPGQQQFNGKPWQNRQPGQQQFNSKSWQNRQPGQQQFNGKPWQNAQPGQQQFNSKSWQNRQPGQQQFNGKPWQNAQPGQQQFNSKSWQNRQPGQQQFNSKSWQNRQPGQQQFNGKPWQNAQPGQQQFNSKSWQNRQPGQQQFNGKSWQNAQPGQQQFNSKSWQNDQPGQQQFNSKSWQNRQPGQQQFNSKSWQNTQPGQQQFYNKSWTNSLKNTQEVGNDNNKVSNRLINNHTDLLSTKNDTTTFNDSDTNKKLNINTTETPKGNPSDSKNIDDYDMPISLLHKDNKNRDDKDKVYEAYNARFEDEFMKGNSNDEQKQQFGDTSQQAQLNSPRPKTDTTATVQVIEDEEYQGNGTWHFISIFLLIAVLVVVGYFLLHNRKKVREGVSGFITEKGRKRHTYKPLSQQ